MSNAAKDLVEYQKHAAFALSRYLDKVFVNIDQEHASVSQEEEPQQEQDEEDSNALPVSLVLYGKAYTTKEIPHHQKSKRYPSLSLHTGG